MIYTIENEFLRVSAEDSGAELRSITLRKNGKEFLWQGDPSVWYGRAPVLFPVVGQLLDGKYSYNGREYELAKHGFAAPLGVHIQGAERRLHDLLSCVKRRDKKELSV